MIPFKYRNINVLSLLTVELRLSNENVALLSHIDGRVTFKHQKCNLTVIF
jgi:hypothetical protein